MQIPASIHPVLKALAGAAVVALPAAVALGLVYAMFGTHPGRFRPSLTDEFNYWHQIATFAARGWGGGQYSVEEHPATAAFSRFGVHGPVFVVAYGMAAKVVGWRPWSAPVFNLGAVTAAIALFLGVGRPNLRQMGLVALVLAVFWPLHTFLLTNLQEGIHYTWAIVLAALFGRLITQRGQAPRWLSMVAGVLIVVGALMRPTWGILLLPLFLLAWNVERPRHVLFATATAGALMALLVIVYGLLAAPYPTNILAKVRETYASDPWLAGMVLERFFLHNAKQYAVIHFANSRELLATIQRLGALILLAASLIPLIRAACVRWLRGAWPSVDWAFHGFQSCNLAGIVLLCALLRPMATFHEYRPMAPHLLLTLLVYVLTARRVVPLVFGVAYAALLVVFLHDFHGYHQDHFAYDANPWYGPPARAAYRHAIADRLTFDPTADRWGNTLLVDLGTYKPLLVLIPPGIGISRVFDWRRVAFPIRSRYLLIAPGSYRTIWPFVRVRPLAVTPFGNLYLNLDSPSPRAR